MFLNPYGTISQSMAGQMKATCTKHNPEEILTVRMWFILARAAYALAHTAMRCIPSKRKVAQPSAQKRTGMSTNRQVGSGDGHVEIERTSSASAAAARLVAV